MLAAVAAVGAVAPIRPLAREPPYAEGAALKKKKNHIFPSLMKNGVVINDN